MENLGALALLLALCLSVYAVVGSLVGRWKQKPFLILSAERAVYSMWILLASAVGILIHALVTGDFRLSYVAQNTNHAMPWYYKVTAWWGGMAGSLMLWAFVLASYSVVVVYQNRRKFREMMPYVVTVLMIVESFFLLLI